MSNIGLLWQMPATSIDLVTGGDWRDQFYQAEPGWPQEPFAITGTLSMGSTTVSNIASTAQFIAGMPVGGLGVAPGTVVESITSASELVLSKAPLLNLSAAALSLWGPPLDLTGIDFHSQLRLPPNDAGVLLDASTTNGLMTNGGPNGYFGWNAAGAILTAVPWPAGLARGPIACVTDIVASDGTRTVNLCTLNGPIQVTVRGALTTTPALI